MPDPSRWKVARYEISLDQETGLINELVIAFRSPSGSFKTLRFAEPRLSEFGVLQVPLAEHLSIADLSSLGWEAGRQIEVRDWDEDRPVLFYAASVEEV